MILGSDPNWEVIFDRTLKQELVLSLYSARKITLVQASDLATRNLFDFQALLRDRQIPQRYNDHDLEQYLQALRERDAK